MDSSFISEKSNGTGSPAGVLINGDLYLAAGAGLILTSPNGTYYRLYVGDDGVIYSQQVTLP